MKDDKRSFRQKTGDFLSGRGFYIALTACVLVIGISAWTLLFTGDIADRTDVADGGDGTVMAGIQENSGEKDAITIPIIDRDKTPETKTQENGEGETESEQETKPEKNTDSQEQTPPTETPAESETAQTMAPAEQLRFMWPVYGDVAVGYFKDELVYSRTMMDWRTHSAVDISAELGTQVVAAANGTVEQVYNDDLLGTTVVIDHGDGLKSSYSNLAGTPTVAAGDGVAMGDVIGSVGNTAIGETGEEIHLHFAMSKDGESVSPLDYLPSK